jgi:hypothetical protein
MRESERNHRNWLAAENAAWLERYWTGADLAEQLPAEPAHKAAVRQWRSHGLG